MCLLTDTDIVLRMDDPDHKKQLKITPFVDSSLTSVGYDLRAGGLYASSKTGDLGILGEPEAGGKPATKLILYPNSTTLVTTLEEIRMPENCSLTGFLFSKVSKVSRGLSHVSTTVDANWKGRLLVAIHNHSTQKLELDYGETFCTIVFIENRSKPTNVTKRTSGRNDVLIGAFAKDNLLTKYSEWWIAGTAISILIAFFLLYKWYFDVSAKDMAGGVGTILVSVVTLILARLIKK
jgi:deoxycytidine triphosphate deaminase